MEPVKEGGELRVVARWSVWVGEDEGKSLRGVVGVLRRRERSAAVPRARRSERTASQVPSGSSFASTTLSVFPRSTKAPFG